MIFLCYIFRDGLGGLCCWLEGVPIVQGIVVPAVTLERYPLDNRNTPQCPSGELSPFQVLLNHLDYHGPDFVGIVL